jgi:tetratricopeptide (TPR) repeat protein
LGETDRALAAVEAAARLDPALADIYRVRGQIKLAQGDNHGARADLGLYLTYRASDATAWYYSAQAGVALQDETKALADFDRALALEPNYVDALTVRGEYLLSLARYEAAEADFARALGQADTARIRLGRGRVYYELGNLEQAITDFRRAVNRDPQNYAANYWLGRTLVEAELPADATAPLGAALELADSDQQQFDVLLYRAAAYRLLSRLEPEAADLQRLAALNVAAGPERRAAVQRLAELHAQLTATVIAASASSTPTVTRTAAATISRTAVPTKTSGTPAPSATPKP